MALADLMTTTATLERPTAVRGQSGGNRPVFAAVGTSTNNVPCNPQGDQAGTTERYMQNQLSTMNNVYFLVNIGALAGDRLILSDGSTLLVQGYQDASAGRGIVFVAKCEQVLVD